MLLRSSTVLMYRLSRSASRCWSRGDFRLSAGTACPQQQPCCPALLRAWRPHFPGSDSSTGCGGGFGGQQGQSLPICGGLLAMRMDGWTGAWTGGRMDGWVGGWMSE